VVASIRIFAPGAHRSSKGEELTFSAEDVAAIAGAYDPSRHQAPLVKGHPSDDAPAYGWVERLAVEDGALVAEFGDVDQAVKADVDAGRYRFVSSAFYRPDEKSNPTPGKWHLRHVGLLGAVPPAVKGLGRVQFAGGEDTFVDVAFGERPSDWSDALTRIGWVFTGLANMMRGQRERLIEAHGLEEADKSAPSYQIEQLTEAAVELRGLAREHAEPRPALFSDPQPNDPASTITEEDPVTTPDPKLQAEIDRLNAENQTLRQADAERAAKAAHQANVAFAEGLVKDAKLPQGQVATVVSLLDHLVMAKADKPVTFSDGDGKTMEPVDALKSLLSGLAPKVAFGELVAGDTDTPAVAFSLPAGEGFTVDGAQLELHRKAVAYQRQHQVPYDVAIAAVGT
jgi:hypothetical protein